MNTKYNKQKAEKNLTHLRAYALTVSLFAFFFLNAVAQNSHELKINEMFINNQDNLVDIYGNRMPWLEIFNTSQVTLDIADYYLTGDTTGLTSKEIEDKAHWYKIPKGDSKTIIPQGGYLVFFLGNMPQYGTLHANFSPLDTPYNNYVALIHPNGHELLHLFTFPEDLRVSDKSYGYVIDFGPETFMRDGVEMQNLGYLDIFSPGTTNNHEIKPVKEAPKNAVLTVLLAAVAIFMTIFLFLLMLKPVGKFFLETWRKFLAKKVAEQKIVATVEFPVKNTQEEEMAAIGMALHLYLDTHHDEESEILTFDTTASRYSPWAQKNLVLRRVARK
jgi:hypothetical protein